MAKKQLRDYVFAPGAAGLGTVKVHSRYTLEELLLITNSTDNVFLYNFADPTYAGTTVTFTAANSTEFPTVTQNHDGFTTINLAISTSTMSSTDKLQIFVTEENEKIRPYDFGTDAIERMRVSNPQALLDADFEYGLQPTKWAGYGTVRGYPSAYELPGIDLVANIVTTDYQTTSTTNSLITVGFTTAHGLFAGNVINISSLNRAITNFSRADGIFVINSIPTVNQLTYFARGTVGTVNGQSLLTDDTLAKRGNLFAGATIPVSSAASNGANPSTITLTTTSPHGLIPGTPINANVATGTFANIASGPFIVLSVPTSTTLTYLARAGGIVATPAGVVLHAFSNYQIIHRPFDGGVNLETRSPVYGASVVRQSKKYFRYQSGKGFLWSTGTLMRPNYDVQSVTANATPIGSTITITTDDINHGLQVGATVVLEGVTTSGYNGTYIVASIASDFAVTVIATSVLGDTTAILDFECRLYVTVWHGAVIRAGLFDEQNGVFWEYNGSTLSVVKRSATFQITGRISTTIDSNAVTGTNTRFTQQVRVGDKMVIRGMTHFVANVISDTSLSITPDYRGITAAGIRSSIVREQRIPQSQFNLDTVDGNGPSGYNYNLSKMQMLGIQYSWYGAGFIDFMIRGSDGNWVFAHRIKNNNVNNEAYMRSGNLPVRYSVENDGANSYLTGAMDASQTTVPLADLTYFPDSGTVYIDNELISYTGRSATTGAGNLTGCTRAATLSQNFAGTTNSLTAAAAISHASGVGVILVSNTCSPTLSHWGSALIMDGGYDEDRGYIFNYGVTVATPLTWTKTAFLIRLAPSVSNSQTGGLGVKDLLNRSQLLLSSIAGAVFGGTATTGPLIVEGILNPKNFQNATWSALEAEAVGGQPSFAQVATSVTWSTGNAAVAGEQVFAYAAPSSVGGTSTERLDLAELKELTGGPIGGDFKFPDGPDILAINVRMGAGTATSATIYLRWGEAQA
jgi:hypothetical protein